jgi:uncharacterized protein YbdZ (MbtH family)
MNGTEFKVIVDTQAKYSVWPEDLDPPLGWSETEASGSLLACLDYVSNVWADREVDTDTEQFVVISDEDDILSISLANDETPSGWTEVTGPSTLNEALARIKQAWDEGEPLPVQLRSDTSSEES